MTTEAKKCICLDKDEYTCYYLRLRRVSLNLPDWEVIELKESEYDYAIHELRRTLANQGC